MGIETNCEKALADSEGLLQKIAQESNDLAKCMLGTGAVEYLGRLANYAGIACQNDSIRGRYKTAVQGLADFCESQGHPNSLKEWSALSNIKTHFSDIRVPKALAPD